MSSEAEVEQRRRVAADLHEATRLNELRERLTLWRGRTVVIDVSDPEHQDAHLHAVIERIGRAGEDWIEVSDLSNARAWPKPVRRIDLARIRSVRVV